MPGMRKETPKGGTSNCSGDAARQVGIIALKEHEAFVGVSKKGGPQDEVGIDGRFLHTIKPKPLKAGHAKTDAYIDNQRRLGGHFS